MTAMNFLNVSKKLSVFCVLSVLLCALAASSPVNDAVAADAAEAEATVVVAAVNELESMTVNSESDSVDDELLASVDAEDKAFDKNPTCSGVSSATDIYILDTNKDNLWCAYNDSIILKMSNTATNQGLDICKWRYITCTGGVSVVYTLIYQGISGTTKYLYCQTTGTYDFCGKMILTNPLEDWGQFWLRTSTFGIDTFKANTINKYAADISGLLGTNINAQYFKTCAQSAINTC